MSILRLDQTKQLFSGGKELASAWLNGQRVWAKPSNDPFPQLSGDFIHVRMEDATGKAAKNIPFTHRNGSILPTTFDLETSQTTPVYQTVNDVNFLSMGGLRAIRSVVSNDVFPFRSGFSIWTVIKPNPDGVDDRFFGMGKGSTDIMYVNGIRRISSCDNRSYTTFTTSTDVSKAEVQHYNVPSNAIDVKDAQLRINDEEIISVKRQAVPSQYAETSINLNLNGTGIAVIGRPSTPSSISKSNAVWRDIVFKLGSDFTDAERAALQEYGQARIKGLI